MVIAAEEPVIERGWFSVTIDRVQAVYMDASVDDASFARYVKALAREIANAPDGERRGIFYETPDPGTVTAARRRQVAGVLIRERDKLARVTAGYVLVTPSMFARGVVTAVFWIAPPPYEHHVVATSAEGFAWLSTRLPELNASACDEVYRAVRAECLQRMHERFGI
jgi:hypothetical protein